MEGTEELNAIKKHLKENRPKELVCTVEQNQMLTPSVFEIKFQTQVHLGFLAGQFISIVIPGAGPKGRDLRRAYSLASPPEMRPIELCVKILESGPGTSYLKNLKPGDNFKGYAPYGDFVYQTPESKRVCFIATGTGVAPFRGITLSKTYQLSVGGNGKANRENAQRVLCVCGFRSEAEILYHEDLSSQEGLEWVPAISRPESSWKGFRGRVTDYIRQIGNDFPWLNTHYYLCGNGEMITEVKNFLFQKGVTKESIHQEKYY